MSYRLLLLTALGALLAACATTTPYQPLHDGQGYAERKLEANRYRITFDGNFNTSQQTVEDFLLYRAAELTLADGGDYFVLAQQDTRGDTRYVQTLNTVGSDVFATRGLLGVGVSTATPTTQYQAQADVVIYKGKKPAHDPHAYDARQIRQNLGAHITRPPP